jgi:hypothetical protein
MRGSDFRQMFVVLIRCEKEKPDHDGNCGEGGLRKLDLLEFTAPT